jgi:exopolysaccharide biosynthesis WecB/TagA/CpsF family protein
MMDELQPETTGHARVAYVGLAFDQLDVVTIVETVLAAPRSADARYLVTPNVDHVVRLHRQHGLRGPVADAYAQADWCVCDSRILAALCRLKGQRLTVAPGSDITRALLDQMTSAGDARDVAVVGMLPDEFRALKARYATLTLHHVCAPFGLARDSSARSAICDKLLDVNAAIVLLAVGAPQQELIALEFANRDGARGVVLCVGASLEFLVRPRTRAPRAVQRAGLEWAFRLLQNPRRMWRRYLYDGPSIFPIAFASVPRLVDADGAHHSERSQRRQADIVGDDAKR